MQFTVRRAADGHDIGILGNDFRCVLLQPPMLLAAQVFYRQASIHVSYRLGRGSRTRHDIHISPSWYWCRFNGYGGITRDPQLDDAVAAEVPCARMRTMAILVVSRLGWISCAS
jgi:hypothetical protein